MSAVLPYKGLIMCSREITKNQGNYEGQVCDGRCTVNRFWRRDPCEPIAQAGSDYALRLLEAVWAREGGQFEIFGHGVDDYGAKP